MFRKNTSFHQQELFGVCHQLTKKQQHLYDSSIEHYFFKNIFCKIDEKRFSVLYSSKSSRPNVPVNQLVGSLILKHLYDWTYEELFKNLTFNLLSRHAIGINRSDTDVFSEASLFNFQNRLWKHLADNGQDLLTEVFDGLTSNQLEHFGVKVDVQRGDSFLIGSNIVDYNRLRLIIEVLKRFYRILDQQDKIAYEAYFANYIRKSSGQYIYNVDKENLGDELSILGKHYHTLFKALKSKYAGVHVFKLFSRIYQEHFCITSDQITVRPSGELHSGILMSPDDPDATFRDKRSKKSKGFVGHLSETANPENQVQLITDVVIEPNNIGDAELLEKRLPEMIRKTPELNEYFTDGLYGGPKVDDILVPNNIKHYQTGIRGRPSYGGLRIYKKDDESIWVRCGGGQDIKSVKKRSWSVAFDNEICNKCPLSNRCKTRLMGVKKGKPKRMWYFTIKKIQAHLRFNNFKDLPEERKTLRASVEASIRQMQRGLSNGKVRVRTKKRVMAYMTLTAIATNLKRIHAYLDKHDKTFLNCFINWFLSSIYNLNIFYRANQKKIYLVLSQ